MWRWTRGLDWVTVAANQRARLSDCGGEPKGGTDWLWRWTKGLDWLNVAGNQRARLTECGGELKGSTDWMWRWNKGFDWLNVAVNQRVRLTECGGEPKGSTDWMWRWTKGLNWLTAAENLGVCVSGSEYLNCVNYLHILFKLHQLEKETHVSFWENLGEPKYKEIPGQLLWFRKGIGFFDKRQKGLK